MYLFCINKLQTHPGLLPGARITERVMKMKYIVNLQFEPFEFTSGSTAVAFAELAKAASVNDIPVGIELVADPEEEFEELTEDDISDAIDYDDYLKEDE